MKTRTCVVGLDIFFRSLPELFLVVTRAVLGRYQSCSWSLPELFLVVTRAVLGVQIYQWFMKRAVVLTYMQVFQQQAFFSCSVLKRLDLILFEFFSVLESRFHSVLTPPTVMIANVTEQFFANACSKLVASSDI